MTKKPSLRTTVIDVTLWCIWRGKSRSVGMDAVPVVP
jgi:hypothetical protein